MIIDWYTCSKCGRITNKICICKKTRYNSGTDTIIAEKAYQAGEATNVFSTVAANNPTLCRSDSSVLHHTASKV